MGENLQDFSATIETKSVIRMDQANANSDYIDHNSHLLMGV